jgi:hypothetical protein
MLTPPAAPDAPAGLVPESAPRTRAGHWCAWLAGGFALLMTVMAIVGGVLNYSAVPYWDMWDGYLGFYLRVLGGDSSAWWSQQSEHRIVLSHGLFWLDLKYFRGTGLALIWVNYMLCGAAVILYYRMFKALTAGHTGTATTTLWFLLAGWLVQWMQQENLTWAFQSQFLLAQLLPLCGLYCLHRAGGGQGGAGPFALACVCGVASAGTMANGILALPIMALYVIVARQGWRRAAVLAGLAVVTTSLYLHDYHRPYDTASLGATFLAHPAGIVRYVLRYFGSPFYFLVGGGSLGQHVALFAGVMFVIAVTRSAFKTLIGGRASLALVLLLFLLYLGGSALGTAGGRLFLGDGQVFASRYTSPALLAWGALLLLHVQELLPLAARHSKTAAAIALLCAGAMFSAQVTALQRPDQLLFERDVAALALSLGVHDDERVVHVYPRVAPALAAARAAYDRKLTVFSHFPLRDAREGLGRSRTVVAPRDCQGAVDQVDAIPGDARYLRLRGWLFDPGTGTVPAFIWLINGQQRVVGFALSGGPRPDVAKLVHRHAARAGYEGYLLAEDVGTDILFQGDASACQLLMQLPPLPAVAARP